MLVIKVPHLHKEEIEFLLEQVLGCTCFSNWMNMRLSRLDDGILGYPRAYWENGWQVFWADEEDAEPFNPYNSLDDAWKLLEEANSFKVEDQLIEDETGWATYGKEGLCQVICDAVLLTFNYIGEEK